LKTERSDIEFPLWRKKVDATLFKRSATPFPKWLSKIWELDNLFSKARSIKDNSSLVIIHFNKNQYVGNVVKTIKSRGGEMYRLFFEPKLSEDLKDTFLMSYMRSIEQDLRKNKEEYKDQDIENEIPFWEFLDIEFDCKTKMFYFKAYYVQKAAYTELFKELVNSHTLKFIDDTINEKEEFRFIKQDWLPKSKLSSQIDAKNVIYNLIDTKNKKIYIGEAESLNNRLKPIRKEIKNWDFYRFDCLPLGLTKTQRVAIERLIIRTFASFFENKKGISTKNVSEYSLANDKIDK
jgi:hypothetical protein